VHRANDQDMWDILFYMAKSLLLFMGWHIIGPSHVNHV